MATSISKQNVNMYLIQIRQYFSVNNK